jgi:hypothetical protein
VQDKMPAHDQPGPFDLIKLVNKLHGVIHTQLICVAVELEIADLLANGKRSVGELAKATGTIEDRLYRVLRVLTTIGIFAETSPGHFELTKMAEPLRADSPVSVRNLALMLGSEWHTRAWSNIRHSLENRESAFEGIYGTSLFKFLQDHPRDASVFNETMTSQFRKQVPAICQAYHFPDAATIVDVGGGHGSLLTQILKENPGLKGVLFDQESVIKDAHAFFESDGLDGRGRAVSGSFFDAVPQGGDIYILKHIIHDYDDDDAVRILRNCRDAMAVDSRILVIDIVMNQSMPVLSRAWTDLEMMVLLNGKERTEDEFRNLFESAGLRLDRIIPTRSEVSILEGCRNQVT